MMSLAIELDTEKSLVILAAGSPLAARRPISSTSARVSLRFVHLRMSITRENYTMCGEAK